ncbi:hypothetical protein [Halorientalis regularis]|uniref:Lipoprotein n=1 Tax=Halorientalis regularis TaxID=660518 RepID=A0A1G7HKE4_9EURY|nr:hypothetical protein [Halorientalis regularis]SDF00796.1 hypothetical protein SAMN05216218_10357 [Halorientalis regularis]
MKRILLTVAVAAMLVLAGCNGGGQGTASPSGTETATNGAQAETELSSPDVPDSLDVGISLAGPGSGGMDTVSSDMYPPGVDSSGVTNTTALVASHFEAAVANAETRMAFRSSGGTLGLVHKNGSSGERLRYVNATTGKTETYWHSGSTVVRRNESKSPPVTYSHGETNLYTGYQFLGIFRVIPFATLNSMSLSVDGTATVDGQQVLRLAVNGFNRSASTWNVRSGLQNASGYVLATPEGVIRELHWEATNVNTSQTESMTVTVSGVGSTSVTRPDWAGEYPDATVSTTSGGQVLALTHEGGDAIPADTRIQVGSGFSAYGNVTLAESLESGETLYVVATGRFGDYNVTARVGSQPSVPENAASFSRRVPSVSAFLDGVQLQYGPEVESGGGAGAGFGAGA